MRRRRNPVLKPSSVHKSYGISMIYGEIKKGVVQVKVMKKPWLVDMYCSLFKKWKDSSGSPSNGNHYVSRPSKRGRATRTGGSSMRHGAKWFPGAHSPREGMVRCYSPLVRSILGWRKEVPQASVHLVLLSLLWHLKGPAKGCVAWLVYDFIT